jgi:hypothetical protein
MTAPSDVHISVLKSECAVCGCEKKALGRLFESKEDDFMNFTETSVSIY